MLACVSRGEIGGLGGLHMGWQGDKTVLSWLEGARELVNE